MARQGRTERNKGRESSEEKKDGTNEEKGNKKERAKETVEERHDENFYRLTSNRAKAVNGYSNMRPCRDSATPWLSNFIFESSSCLRATLSERSLFTSDQRRGKIFTVDTIDPR